MSHTPPAPPSSRAAGRAGPLVVGGLSAVAVALTAATAWRGLDFWDESYWLLLVDRPDASRAAGEVFLGQFLLHPLFVGLGRDVGLFRLLGILLLVLTAGAATRAVVAGARGAGAVVPAVWARTAPLVVAASTMTAFVGAGRSPSYRVVVVVALLLAVWALARFWAGGAPGWGALLGAAGVLAFTGRPTSAVALAVLVVLALPWLGTRPAVARTVGWAVVGALLAAAGVLALAGMTPATAVGYLGRAAAAEGAGGYHSSWTAMLGVVPVPVRVLLVLGPLALLPVLLAVHDARRNAESRWSTRAQLLVGLGAPAVVAALGVWLLSAQGYGAQVRQLLLLWLLMPLGALVVRTRGVRGPRGAGAMVLTLLACPYVATVGTNTNFTPTMTQAAVFWALALVLVVPLVARTRPRAGRLVLPVALLVVTTTLVTQVVWLADDLEGRGVRDGSVATPVLGGYLGVEPDTAAVLTGLGSVSRRYSLAGRPAVDLTGYGAGYQLALGTRPLGRASFFGAFAGAERGAAVALSHATCRDRAEAVVLYAPDNPLDVSGAIDSWGVDLATDYEAVLRFHPTHGEPRVQRQTVEVLLPGPRVGAALGCPGGAG